MAILGGAGNVAGSNPAGTGSSLNYIGNHAYAYSGAIAFDSNETTALLFDVGNIYVKSVLHIAYAGTSSDDMTAKLYLDDQLVWDAQFTSGTSTVTGDTMPLDFIIPSYTKVKLTFASDAGSRTAYAVLKGRVYD